VRKKKDFLFRNRSNMSNHYLKVSSSLIAVNLLQETKHLPRLRMSATVCGYGGVGQAN
jgi:hypothetical protein